MFLRRAALSLTHSRKFFSTNNAQDFANAIAEMNKEMESVFGEPPATSGLGGSINKDYDYIVEQPKFKSHEHDCSIIDKQSQFGSPKINQNTLGLTHVGTAGDAQMVDVSPKENTKRTAIASCKVILGKTVFDMVLANQMAKGDVLTVAKIAGINGAKYTSSLIPLCHNIPITHVRVELRLNPDGYSVEIEGEACSTGKTGVEMEAMTAVSIAGLTVYDMCKSASKEIQITDVRLDRKTGGKSGYWFREE